MSDLELDDDRFCFACGVNNLDGLRVGFEYPEKGRCRAELVMPAKFQGWKGILHGGIISTLLDEAFAHACGGPQRGGDEAVVTAEIRVKVKKPVRTGEKFVLEGRVVEVRGRVIACASVIKDPEGTELARAEGRLIRLKRARQKT